MKITVIFERFIVLMWKHLKFQLFCFCYSVVNVGSVFTEAQPGSTLTALCFEIAYSLLRKIVEREFQILTIMNFMNHWKSNVIFNDLHPLIRLYPLFIGISVVFQCINLYDILDAFSDQAYFLA